MKMEVSGGFCSECRRNTNGNISEKVLTRTLIIHVNILTSYM